ncbi:MAG: CcdB family protein [Myxococcaceae bacterium]|nr:CcdB family protein [Myxococcaceae bacterium]
MMRQFDVYRNPSGSARTVPFLLLIQSDLLDDFPTRMVAPLVRPSSLALPATRLNPTFKIEGEVVTMLTQQLGAVPKRSLKTRVASLDRHRTEIIGAIDFLLGGV